MMPNCACGNRSLYRSSDDTARLCTRCHKAEQVLLSGEEPTQMEQRVEWLEATVRDQADDIAALRELMDYATQRVNLNVRSAFAVSNAPA